MGIWPRGAVALVRLIFDNVRHVEVFCRINWGDRVEKEIKVGDGNAGGMGFGSCGCHQQKTHQMG